MASLTEQRYCAARGIAAEAEPGRIEGGEDGVPETLDLGPLLTTPEEARRFVQTGISMLAPAFGNVHGEYGPRGIQLDYDLLASVDDELRRLAPPGGPVVRLSLHGADPFTKEHFAKCIDRGVCKININKGMNNHYARVQHEMRGKPLTAVIEAGTKAMQEAIEEYMRQMGSSGRA